MKDIFKIYEKKNKITGIIALILICLILARITYGISIVLLIVFALNMFRKNKQIRLIQEEIKKKHDKISKEE